ncbi:hypothetical protein DV702_12910 [Sporosarcina sp. PTS2304]|uniref:hypothetical protein n=1 Tax=Sporosarcina sp. PTS2304 TaxID=2283194 RepID=UPI000E0D0EE0|nr:hypothetical protein [Sporosarcina sp. PTS2304]AXI00541.1 hypothetical protein DV702_12910 [Sporosarcina sp. PTS2304]
MRIVFYEFKKAFTSPILLVLTLLFMSFNIFLIFSNSYYKEELTVANDVAETYGVKITDESLQKLEKDLQSDVIELNQITSKHTRQEYSSVNDFLDSLQYKDHSLYSENEWAIFNQLQLKGLYFNRAKNIDSDYEKINWKEHASDQIEGYSLNGDAAKILRNEYDKLSKRFEEMKESGEHKEWFFMGTQYKMHSFLFKTIFGHLIFESIILIVLATALITNFEFENKTHLVMYPTKRGRQLMKDKLFASFITTTAITALLILITLGIYFSVFDYSNLWGSSISSALNWEYTLPYVAWWDLSFINFLLLSISLVYVCMLLFSAITFAISLLVKNSYFTFFIFAVFFAIAYMVPAYIPGSSKWMIITGFTLSSLVMNPHVFFMGNGELAMFKYYESITVVVWSVFAIASCFCCLKKFNKQEIH